MGVVGGGGGCDKFPGPVLPPAGGDVSAGAVVAGGVTAGAVTAGWLSGILGVSASCAKTQSGASNTMNSAKNFFCNIATP